MQILSFKIAEICIKKAEEINKRKPQKWAPGELGPCISYLYLYHMHNPRA